MLRRGELRYGAMSYGSFGMVGFGALGYGVVRQGRMKGEELKKMRNDLGLTVAAAAKQVEVHPRTWSRWESGERGIPRGVIKLFCMVNDITLHE